MGRSTEGRTRLSEQRKYRSWTAKQKIEIVLAGLRGDRSVKEVCREHEISETLYYSLAREAARGRPRGAGRQGGARRASGSCAGRIARAGAGAGSQDLRARDRGGSIARLGVSERVARSRELVARGFAAGGGGARAAGQPPGALPDADAAARRRSGGRRPDPVEQAIVEVAEANQTDGYRMVTALVRRKLGRRGQPQAGAAGDAGAEADPAPPSARAAGSGPASSGSSGRGSCGSST